jgi:hypothetical protein
MEKLVQREYLINLQLEPGLIRVYLTSLQLYAGLSGFLFVVSFFFVPETAFERPLSAYASMTATVPDAVTDSNTVAARQAGGYTQATRPALDAEKYGPRTLRKTMRLWAGKSDWTEAWLVLKHTAQMVSRLISGAMISLISSMAACCISFCSRTCSSLSS